MGVRPQASPCEISRGSPDKIFGDRADCAIALPFDIGIDRPPRRDFYRDAGNELRWKLQSAMQAGARNATTGLKTVTRNLASVESNRPCHVSGQSITIPNGW